MRYLWMLIVAGFGLTLNLNAYGQSDAERANRVGLEIELEEQQRLHRCYTLVEADPNEAYEFGLKWMNQGARPRAQDCVASSLIAKGHYDVGARTFERLAKMPVVFTPLERKIYWQKAGNAWILEENFEAAIFALSNALAFIERDYDTLADRARAHMLREDWTASERDWTEALSMKPGDADHIYMRAKTLFELHKFDAALQDVQLVMRLDPRDIDALVLRGEIINAKRLSLAAE